MIQKNIVIVLWSTAMHLLTPGMGGAQLRMQAGDGKLSLYNLLSLTLPSSRIKVIKL
jgi:hypothetical protein